MDLSNYALNGSKLFSHSTYSIEENNLLTSLFYFTFREANPVIVHVLSSGDHCELMSRDLLSNEKHRDKQKLVVYTNEAYKCTVNCVDTDLRKVSICERE